jgi:hypothetical protein
MKVENITKEQFLAACNKYPPNSWIKFAFKYFSQNTEKENKWVGKILQYVALALFLAGMIGAIFNFSPIYMKCITFPFCIIIVSISILMGGAATMNNLRIKKIIKELGGISKETYDAFASMYLD